MLRNIDASEEIVISKHVLEEHAANSIRGATKIDKTQSKSFLWKECNVT